MPPKRKNHQATGYAEAEPRHERPGPITRSRWKELQESQSVESAVNSLDVMHKEVVREQPIAIKVRGKGNKRRVDKENLAVDQAPEGDSKSNRNGVKLAPAEERRKGAKEKANKGARAAAANDVDPNYDGHEQYVPVPDSERRVKKNVNKENGDDQQEDNGREALKEVSCEQQDHYVTKARGKGAKKQAVAAAEEHSDSDDTKANGSKAPKEENKRGRKGKPNAAKTEPEPEAKKAKLDEEPENYDCDKINKKGEKWNLKIATWNVASLRACVKKGMLDYVAKEDADIICFQETKCSEKKAPPEAQVEGYHTYWCSGKNDGYAGVALYTKEKPLNVNFGIGDGENDEEGRLITAEYDKFYLVTTYVPNSGQGLKTLPKRMKWDELFLSYLKKLDAQKPVVLCGDLNVAHEEIDLKNPKTNTKSAGFTPEERANMTKLLGEGFVDSFRNLYPDTAGAYTFWTYLGNARAKNTGWRLDYFVLSERLMESVCDVVIRNKVMGSDHCPVTMFIHI